MFGIFASCSIYFWWYQEKKITYISPTPHSFPSPSQLQRLLSFINDFLIIASCDEGLRGPCCYQFTEAEGSRCLRFVCFQLVEAESSIWPSVCYQPTEAEGWRWPDFCCHLIEPRGLRWPKNLTMIILSNKV